MSNFQTAHRRDVSRGTSILDYVAGAVKGTEQGMTEMLGDTCRNMSDWACVFEALAGWDSDAVTPIIDTICEVAEAYGNEWSKRRAS